MKELELTSNAALTDVVYEAALNGSSLNVKLVTGAVGDDEIRGLIPEANHYHVTHPKTSEEILFEQPLDASDNIQSAKPPVHLFKTKRFYFEVLFQNEASLLEQNQTAFKWTSNPI